MNTVLVAMSGGIDSLAVCLMLQEKGCEVAGVTPAIGMSLLPRAHASYILYIILQTACRNSLDRRCDTSPVACPQTPPVAEKEPFYFALWARRA